MPNGSHVGGIEPLSERKIYRMINESLSLTKEEIFIRLVSKINKLDERIRRLEHYMFPPDNQQISCVSKLKTETVNSYIVRFKKDEEKE